MVFWECFDDLLRRLLCYWTFSHVEVDEAAALN
jgi:hypothetical protein